MFNILFICNVPGDIIQAKSFIDELEKIRDVQIMSEKDFAKRGSKLVDRLSESLKISDCVILFSISSQPLNADTAFSLTTAYHTNIYTIVVCTQNAAKLLPSFIHEDDDVPIIMYPDIAFRDQVVKSLESQIEFYRQKKEDSVRLSQPLRKSSGKNNIQKASLSIPKNEGENRITRSIEFSPEHHQAGIAILNYFSQILRQKYPDVSTKIRIEQEDLTVRMIIETPEGFKETVEQHLEEYGLVVSGEMQPEEFLSNPRHVMELKHKLEMARMEVKHAWEMKQLAETAKEERIQSLESEVQHLRTVVAESLAGSKENGELLQLIAKNLAAQHNEAVTQALDFVKEKLEAGATEADEPEIERNLVILKENAPDMFDQFANLARNTVVSASSAGVVHMLQRVIRMIV